MRMASSLLTSCVLRSILGPGLSPMIENQSNRMLYAVSTHPDVELGGKQGELRGGCLIGLLHLS
jgi:hypothetical protein